MPMIVRETGDELLKCEIVWPEKDIVLNNYS